MLLWKGVADFSRVALSSTVWDYNLHNVNAFSFHLTLQPFFSYEIVIALNTTKTNSIWFIRLPSTCMQMTRLILLIVSRKSLCMPLFMSFLVSLPFTNNWFFRQWGCSNLPQGQGNCWLDSHAGCQRPTSIHNWYVARLTSWWLNSRKSWC